MLQVTKLNKELDLSVSDYKNDNTFYCFDLNPDSSSCGNYSTLKDGVMDLDVTLAAGITESITVLFYLEFDNVIEINKFRQINFDYII